LRPPDGGPPVGPDFAGALPRETVLLPPLRCSLGSRDSRSSPSIGHTTPRLDSAQLSESSPVSAPAENPRNSLVVQAFSSCHPREGCRPKTLQDAAQMRPFLSKTT